MQVLLEFGADVHACDDEGETPLHHAAGAGNEGVLRLLLVFGASREVCNYNGFTPAEVANDLEILDILLEG